MNIKEEKERYEKGLLECRAQIKAWTDKTLTNKTLTAVKIATTDGIFDAGGDEYLKFVEAA